MKSLILVALVGSLGLSACTTMTPNERAVVGGLAGAAGGLVLADALGANPNWTIVAALGGAAAGALVARNAYTNECAYADGRGGYVTRRCR
jgi:osmotically inducible lipoprotein OsmB